MESNDPTLQEPSLVPDEFSDPNNHLAIAMEYLSGSYKIFLDGQDVFPEQDAAIEERYGEQVCPWVCLSQNPPLSFTASSLRSQEG